MTSEQATQSITSLKYGGTLAVRTTERKRFTICVKLDGILWWDAIYRGKSQYRGGMALSSYQAFDWLMQLELAS